VLAVWPAIPETHPDGYESPTHFQRLAVNNALNHLLGYPHGVSRADLESRLGVPVSRVEGALRSWRAGDDSDASGRESSTA
jgi:hypothetical protein